MAALFSIPDKKRISSIKDKYIFLRETHALETYMIKIDISISSEVTK